MRQLAATFAWTFAVMSSGCIVEEKCSGDAECGAGRICVDSSCREGCRLSRDCPDGQRCEDTRCVVVVADGDADSDSDAGCEVDCPDDMVPVCGYCIDRYEASRQDATKCEDDTCSSVSCSIPAGTDSSIATSRPDVCPWTNMTRDMARAACEAAGKRLCRHDEWIAACVGPDDTAYPYGDDYEPETCNGIDTYGRGFQKMRPTGFFPGCVNEYGVYDISGNIWEIDDDMPGWVHGGAYNCIDSESLHLCNYNQNFGTDPLPNVGFRCCHDGL